MTRVLEDWIEILKDLGSNLEKKKPSPDGFEPLTSGYTVQRSTTCAVCQRSHNCLGTLTLILKGNNHKLV